MGAKGLSERGNGGEKGWVLARHQFEQTKGPAPKDVRKEKTAEKGTAQGRSTGSGTGNFLKRT